MRWRGSIYRFAFCTCDFLCTTLVPSSQTQTVWRRATCDLFPSRTPLVPRAPSSLSALQIAIAMGAFPALTRTRFSSMLPSLHCKLYSESRDPAVEPSPGLPLLPSGTIGARLLPSLVFLSLDLSFVRTCLYLFSVGAPTF